MTSSVFAVDARPYLFHFLAELSVCGGAMALIIGHFWHHDYALPVVYLLLGVLVLGVVAPRAYELAHVRRAPWWGQQVKVRLSATNLVIEPREQHPVEVSWQLVTKGRRLAFATVLEIHPMGYWIAIPHRAFTREGMTDFRRFVAMQDIEFPSRTDA